MKKKLQKVMLFFTLSVSILGCSSDSGSSSDTPSIDYVKDAPSLMRNMRLEGAITKDGDIPVPVGVLSDNIASMPSTVIVTSNSLFRIPIKTTTTDGRIPRIAFIKLVGSNKYYQIDLDENGNPIPANRQSSSDPRVQLSCTGYPNIRFEPTGGLQPASYENYAEVYTFSPPLQTEPIDFAGLFFNTQYWSNPRQIKFKALDVGTGDVQVSLTWDTQSDVDLWLTEPNGNKIKWNNKQSSTGGALDFDNTIEYGPENIFYQNIAPSGTYKVEVNYFSGSPTVTNYNVVVKNGNVTNSYEGTLSSSSQTDLITEFVK